MALAADVVARLILLVLRLVARCGNGQIAVLIVQSDVFLLHARQIGGQLVMIVHLLDVHLEGGSAPVRGGKAVAEERIAHRVEECERIRAAALREITTSGKRYQSKHSNQLLEIHAAARLCAPSFIVFITESVLYHEAPRGQAEGADRSARLL